MTDFLLSLHLRGHLPVFVDEDLTCFAGTVVTISEGNFFYLVARLLCLCCVNGRNGPV